MPFSVSASQTTIMTESIRLPASTLKPSTVALPGSKSISNRTLLLAALSDNVCEIHSLLKSDDTDRMLEALDKLGVQIESLPEGRLKVQTASCSQYLYQTARRQHDPYPSDRRHRP